MIAGFICLTGVVLAVVFVRRELDSKRPILPVDLLMRPIIGLSAIGGLVAFMGSTTMIFSLPFRLQQQFGWLPVEVGAVIAPWPAATAFAGFIGGILSDRFPAGLLGAIGMAIAVVAMMMLAFLGTRRREAQRLQRNLQNIVAFGGDDSRVRGHPRHQQ